MGTNTESTAIEGTYKVGGGKYTAVGGAAENIEIPDNSLTFTKEYELDEQTTAQEIDVSKDDKKTFSVKFKNAFTTAPKIYPDKDSDKEISCTADKDNKVLTCTPTTTNMTEGKKYNIVFAQACSGTKTDTKITVTATKLSSSSYMKVSQIILLAGLILL